MDVYLSCTYFHIREAYMNIVKPESVGLSSERLGRIKSVMQAYTDGDVRPAGTTQAGLSKGGSKPPSFAGISTLVAQRGKVVHLETFGWQDLETRKPITEDTIFRIYSMTKPITSAAVMMLCEEGRLRLSDPVSRHVPEFKDRKVMVLREGGYDLVPAAREVTIHDLLTHTSGLCYGSDEEQTPLDEIYREAV